MSKLLNYKMGGIVLAVLISVTVGMFGVRSCFTEKVVLATLSHSTIELGEVISFCDSTKGADTWMWEFGNGEKSTDQKGQYVFPQTGKYQVRLTINQSIEKYFIVQVRELGSSDQKNPIIRINGPGVAMQNEIIVFKGVGEAKEWRWEFGETGMVDAREKNCMYAYQEPGIYEVQLSTDNTQYPVRYEIEILPVYQDNDSTDVMSIIGQDIKRKLQAIADGKMFNVNYNAILQQYLCANPNTLVVINNNKFNDFYSYCQGLRITGKTNETLIDNVIVDIDKNGGSCIKQVNVIQYDQIAKNQKSSKP